MKPKTEIDKPEDRLVRSLDAVLRGGRPDNDEHLDRRGGPHYYDGSGSQNWDPMGMALCYHEKVPGAREELIEREIPYQREKFMGSEFNSADPYGAMHLVSRAAVAMWAEKCGDDELAAAFREWLLFWGCLQCLCRRDDGLIMISGQRCAPSPFGNVWAQWFLACGGVGSLDAALAALRRAGQAPQGRGAWKVFAGAELSPVLRKSFEPLRHGLAPNVIPRSFHAAPGFNVRRYSGGGIAVWCETCTNSNTSPVMGSVSVGAEQLIRCLPESFSHHPNMGSECRVGLGALLYDGQELSLPTTPEIFRFRIPRSGEGWPGEPSSSAPKPQNPPKEIDVEALAAEVVALGAQDAETAAAVALVRSVQWTAASLAVFKLAVPRRNQAARVELSDRLARMA